MTTLSSQTFLNHRNSWSVRMVNSILHHYALDQAVWHYEHGLMVTAIAEAGKALGESRFMNFVQDWIDHFVSEDGAIRTYRADEYNLDQVNPGKLLFHAYQTTGAERYRRAIELIRNQLHNQPRTHNGGYWHKKIYPYQMWLDGIYMATPFSAQYALVFDEPAAFDDITHQIIVCEQHTRDPRTGLLYHAWDESKSQKWANPVTGCSPSFWGRAIGWFVMALVDVLDFLPPGHQNFPVVLAILQRLADTLIRYQDPETGLWYQVVDAAGRPGNYRESSASAMLAYGFAKGARKGWLGSDFLLSAHRAYRGLLENQIKVDGRGLLTLENVCSVGGLGGDPYRDGSYDYYISEKVIANDFKGVGPFVLAALELESSEVIIKGSD
jgi:unsaturated rhamnogalacturonyl hydrolase